MRTFTIKQMLAEKPCSKYRDEAYLKTLWAGRDALCVHEIATLDIPPADRVWAMLRCLDPEQQIAFANKCADRAVEKYALHCGHEPIEKWAASWLDGTDRSYESAASTAWAERAAAWTGAATTAVTAVRAAAAAAAAAGAESAASAAWAAAVSSFS
jgi:hypothetical protein